MIFSFIPRHVGTFIVKQVVDIIGPVTTKDGLLTLKMEPFHQINLSFSGICKSVTNRAVIKSYPGMLLKNKKEVTILKHHFSLLFRRGIWIQRDFMFGG